MADRARKKTEKLLRQLERRVKAVYANDPQLKKVQKEYERYMMDVKDSTYRSYLAYKEAETEEDKRRLKKEYTDEVKKLTLENKTYKSIVRRFTREMARVNQKALDLVNAEMPNVYMVNYNQMAVDCRKLGIKVNG